MAPTITTALARRIAGLLAATAVLAGLLLVNSTLNPAVPSLRGQAVEARRAAAARRVLPLLAIESRGRDVAWVQRRVRVHVDGIFGPKTLAAVVRFQRRHGLYVDGVVGPKTTRVLQSLSRSPERPTRSCIIGAANHFRNDWGEPRSGGRRHEGNDVMAAYGAPVLAIGDGVVERSYISRLGGRSIILRVGDVKYYYAHQSRNLVRGGQHVKAGQVIGLVGTSGNARGGPAHVHFERWEGPDGKRVPVNPYRTLREVC